MKTTLMFLLTFLIFMITLSSCEENCSCDSVVYESTLDSNYDWIEISRTPSEECNEDTLSSTFLDNNGNISYVRTILECN